MGNVAAPCPHRSSASAYRDLERQRSAVESRLHVTPSLSVPWRRLRTQACHERVAELARAECSKGLVDGGASFSFGSDARVLRDGHPHGFIAAATAAFANHYPLSIRPQHFWMMILQGIAVHVQLNAEEVRDKWVPHEGKRRLVVSCDDFTLGETNTWAAVVDGKVDSLSAQIDQSVVPGVKEDTLPAFSDTTTCEKMAFKIAVMDACQSFFSYECKTMCGFPSVTMEGSLEDWQLLRSSAQLLILRRCTLKFSERWCAALLPLLDLLVAEYHSSQSGNAADAIFWNSMCKRGGHRGSGARTWYNGWINVFFPYIKNRPNGYMVPYSPSNGYAQEGRDQGVYASRPPHGVQGPDCVDFPEGLASAPVAWDYMGSEIQLKFKAGFVGATQDWHTGVIKPLLGWFVAHDGEAEAYQARKSILVLGLDASGKTAILRQLGLGSFVTAAAGVETAECSPFSLTACGLAGWQSHARSADGLMFVVDGSDHVRIGDAREALAKVIDDAEVREKPLVVCCNKMDVQSAMSASECTEKLGLCNVRNRQWFLQSASAESGSGLQESLQHFHAKLVPKPESTWSLLRYTRLPGM